MLTPRSSADSDQPRVYGGVPPYSWVRMADRRQRGERRREDIAEQRKRAARSAGRLHVQRRRRQGHLRRQVALDPQARRRATSRAGRRSVAWPTRSSRSTSSSPSTEAEALLAEQQFIKRHRPLLNVKLRDDKSYPYIGISLDEEFPRVYFTRERHRPNRAYFGPYASARRVRETLELLGKLFQYRTCEGAEPGRRSGVPCLDYYIKRCGAPCVGYIDAEEYRRNIDAIAASSPAATARSSATCARRWRRPPPPRSSSARPCSATALDAIRSLMERQRVAGEQVGTADLIGVAVEGQDANAQVFQVRDGVLAERQGFYLDNKGERRRSPRSPSSSSPSTTRPRRRCRRSSSSDRSSRSGPSCSPRR